MISHQDIEARSLDLARAIVARVDCDPRHQALELARERCRRWLQQAPCADLGRWEEILKQPWPAVRGVLLDPSDEGKRLRQSNPFCGVLSPRERWEIYRRFRRHDLAISKLAAGREKDLSFVSAMLKHGLIVNADIVKLLDGLSVLSAETVRRSLRLCLSRAGVA